MTLASQKSQQGFSLLELLVAFAIMALSLGMIYKAMGAGARHAGDMSLHQQASMLSESLLNTRDSVAQEGWNESGVASTFAWKVSSKPYASDINSTALVPLHHIFVVVSWFDGAVPKQLELQTLLPQRQPLPGEAIK